MKKRNLLLMLLLAIGLPWVANAQTLTVCDGTDNSQYVPFEGYNADANQHNQMIFPATDLTAMNGKEITQMVFYIDQSASNGSNTAASRLGTWTVSLGETTATTLSGLDNTTTLTQVYQGYFDCSTGTLTLAFSSNYLYHGGNLLVDLNHAAASWNRWYFLGVNQTENTAITRGSLYKFLPKTTFSYQTPPTCPTPRLAAAQNITASQASFSWTENGSATNWVLQYSTSEEFTNATSVNVQDTPTKAINDFQPLTTYYVRVKADCGEGDQSQWSNVISFSTTAVAQNVGDAWSDDFEGTTCGWELINGTVTQANWFWGTAENSGSGSHSIYTTNDNGNTCSYNTSSAARVYAAKLLTFADGKYTFQFDWKCNGETTSFDYLSVGLLPATAVITADNTNSGTLPTGWISVHDATYLNGVTAWQTSPEKTVQLESGNYYLVLRWRQDGSGGTGTGAAVDNVSITKMACDQDVTDLAVSEITTTSATLSWNGGEATQWQVAYSTASNFEGATEEIVSNALYNMSGLQSSSTYYVKVRAYCGGEDFGTWSDVLSFNTDCDAITTFPWTETFESYSAGDFNAPCWVNEHISGNGTQIFKVYTSSNGSNSTHQLQLPDMSSGTMTKLMLPEMTLPGDDYLFSIDVYRNTSTANYGEGIRVFVSTDGEIEGATELAFISRSYATSDGNLIPAESTSGWYTYELPIGISGTCYIILRGESLFGSSTYMDNFAVKQMPSCLKPTALECTATSTTSATFGWTNGAADQTAWQICLNGDETNLIMANSNPFTVEGLTASTHYTAKVRAYCGADDQSDWSNEVSFATACEAITDLPWNENFDAYTGSTSAIVPTGYPNDELPTCWQFLNRSDNSSTYPQVFISSINSYPVSGNCLFFKSSSTTPLYAVLPAFEEEISGLQLTFTYRNEGTSDSNGTLIVGYMTDPADANTFTTVLTCEKTTTLTEMEVLFTDAPTGSYIAFKYQGGTYDNYYLSIDNVKVDVIPTCIKPTDLSFVSSTTTTATLSWTAGADETAWQICINGDETNLIPANSNPFTVEGLTASANYTAKVRAYCSADDQSDWSNEVSFATECETIVVTGSWSEGFEVGVMPACWSQEGDATWTIGTGDDNTSPAIGAHTGTYNAKITHSTDGYVTKLITPVLDLTSLNSPMLTFWYINRQWGNDIDGFAVYYRTAEDAEWTQIDATEEAHATWTEATYVLPNPSATYQIAFEMTDGYGYGVGIDDITIAPSFTKTIAAVGEEGWANGKGGYYFIASPLAENVTPTADNGFIVGDYDLYYFDQACDADGNEWINYKANGGYNLTNGKGYLYASKEGTTLTFTGTPGTDGNVPLDNYDGNARFKGWNLIGNPFAQDAYIDKTFYTLENGDTYTTNTAENAIHAMQGVLIIAEEDETSVTFTTEAPATNNGKLNMNLRSNNKQLDNAILVFGGEQQLGKISFREGSSKVYMPVEGKDYAITSVEGQVGEMPVSFKAENNGTYSLSFTSEEVSFSYLHLIDNMTGADVDLLETPSYTFDARTSDYESRFRLVFATGSSVDGDTFGFVNASGNFCIFGIEGEATVQVIDVLGHVLSNEQFSGSYEKRINGAPGVYMVRLIQGNDVKVQKVVVR